MVALPYLWLLLFFVVPFVIVLKISFSDVDLAIPPYKPLLEWVGKNSLAIRLNFNNYAFLFTDPLYMHAFLNSIKVAFISTLLCLIIGYPIAYGIARATPTTRNILLLLVVLPFWTSLLLRVYAWIGLLKANGVINNVLIWLGLIHEPLTHAVHAVRHVRRHRLLVPAVPDPAAVCESGKDGLAAARGGGGSRLPPVAGVLQDHAAPVAQRDPGGLHAGVHPGGGRVRHPGPARRPECADDRARAVGRVLLEPRMAGGERGRDPAAACCWCPS